MSAEDAEEYTRALGQIMSGGWRQLALAQRLGVPEAVGMTTESWVRDRIGGYVRLGLDERREAVRELTDPDGEFQLTQRQAAEVLGISVGTVNGDLRGVQDRTVEEVELEEDVGSDVQSRTAVEFAEQSVEVGLADIEVDSTPVVGDVRDEIRAGFDEEALAAEQAQARHIETMARVRVTWLRFVSENPPGVFLDGLDRAGLAELGRDLDRFITWLEQVRALSSAARRPRRVV
jgi:transcriptional regulator with XRE-family HTH domain